MKLPETDHRQTAPVANARYIRWKLVILFLLIATATWLRTGAQQTDAAPIANLTADQVVHNLVQMNLYRTHALYAYQGTRAYRAEYHGLAGARSAEMIVSVKYQSPRTKEFTVQSSTGSKLIIDKVFKKLLEAEKEALGADVQRRSALTEDNYRFTLVGYENGQSGATYVLGVEPRAKDKFLYRGRIWVDAEDFAVVRVEAEPAKNPSFWTKESEIVQVYKKVGDFWLPAHNRSVSAIRFGGHAEMTIDYKDYEITGANGVSSLSTNLSVESGSRTDGLSNVLEPE